jgi:CheY-like chemotaxis protein
MRHTILLADDSPTIQRLVNQTFADTRFDIVTVNNGDAAIRKFDEIEPDIVLADIYMPGKNGYEVCAHVKSHATLAGTPVILLVGAFDAYDAATAAQAGATAHITKPFEPRALVELVISSVPEGTKARKPAKREEASIAQAPPIPESVAAPAPVLPEKPAEEPVEPVVESVAEPAAAPAISMAASAAASVAASVPMSDTGDLLGLNHLYQPDVAPANVAAQLSEEDIDRIADRVIRKLSTQVVEGIAWDVVPDIAVKILRDELKKTNS